MSQSQPERHSDPVRRRTNTLASQWWTYTGSSDWTSCFFIMTCYRLSRRALEEAIRCIEETREYFSELTLPSAFLRAGMILKSINSRQTHWSSQTFKTAPHKATLIPTLLNHRAKSDNYASS